MARKIEVPKINTVTVQYNGNSKEFDRFMESMIHEFLNSCSIAMLSFYHPPLAGTLCGACVTTDNTTQPPASPALTPIFQNFLRYQ